MSHDFSVVSDTLLSANRVSSVARRFPSVSAFPVQPRRTWRCAPARSGARCRGRTSPAHQLPPDGQVCPRCLAKRERKSCTFTDLSKASVFITRACLRSRARPRARVCPLPPTMQSPKWSTHFTIIHVLYFSLSHNVTPSHLFLMGGLFHFPEKLVPFFPLFLPHALFSYFIF